MDTKICSKCGELKPTTSFYKRSDRASGYKSECKKCNNSYEKIVNRESQAIRARKSWLKTSYGMTLEDYDELLEEQEYLCAVCHTHVDDAVLVSGRHFCVDHNHETGEVRGLLCHLCNTMLGKARDNPDILMAGSLYLLERGSYANFTT